MDEEFHIIILFTPRGVWCKEKSVHHPFRQMPISQQLDFNLVKPSNAIFSFDIHHAEFIVKKFLVVVGIEYFDFGDW